jgi:glyoxalase family protein
VLRDVLGYDERGAASGEHGATTRFISGNGGVGAVVDVREAKGFPRGVMGGGTVHHVAFRAADDADQAQLRRLVIDAGMHPTPVVERFWFRSVYFHEPGGVLFELATDAPGFAVDEPLDSLGTRLMLPPWLEPHRAGIEAALPDLGLPEPAAR